MKTRKMILIAGVVVVGAAVYSENTAAIFVALATTGQLLHLHTIEVKLNKLLDAQGLVVTSEDLDR